MTDTDIVATIRLRHREVMLRLGDLNAAGRHTYNAQCNLCREPWPCDVVRLTQHIEELKRDAPKIDIRHVGDEHSIPIAAMSGEVVRLFESNPMYEITITVKGQVHTFKSAQMLVTNETDHMVQRAGFFE